MQPFKKSPKFILSGGGTGGHIYPAIAIANEIKDRLPQAEILFVGAKDKMEMTKVPKAGYPIKGLWISGLQRKRLWANVSFPFKLMDSVWKARKIISDFQPDACIGTGGFASGPTLWAAAQKKIPVLLQEQNSFPGITNKLLKNKAFAVCTAYDNMENYFPKEIIHTTGNPIRADLFTALPEKHQAKESFGLDPEKPVILSVGGSLGARSLNQAWEKGAHQFIENDIQLLWQTGQLEYEKIKQKEELQHPNLHITDFIYKMKEAYSAADIIVSRAGAMAISELCLVGKPTLLVPFPFAAEDHQTKNAQNLESHQAAIMVKDSETAQTLVQKSIALMKDETQRELLSKNIQTLGKPEATKDIVDILFHHLNIQP